MRKPSHTVWGVVWLNKDGTPAHLIHYNLLPILFKTRKQARLWIEDNYGYIRHRPDLKREPHRWRVPQAVRVRVAMV